MPITFTCDCGKPLQAEDQYAGRKTRCPGCGRELVIPGRADAVQAAGETPPAGPARWDDRSDESHAPPRTSGKALASLIVGIVSMCLPVCVPSVIAIVLGILGLKDVSRGGGKVKGQGLAIGGIATGTIGLVVIFPLAMVVGLLVPAVQRVRSAANRVATSNNMRQIGIALHNYNDVHGQLPPSVVYDKDGKPLYSWRVLLLPYLDQNNLYQRFHLDEPWDSPHNKSLLSLMPKVYTSPSEGGPMPPDYKTHYLVFDSPNCIWDSGVEARRQRPSRQGLTPFQPSGQQNITVYQSGKLARIPASFADGTSNTIMIIEADHAVPWTKPEDLSYAPDAPLPALGSLHSGNLFMVGLGDASSRPVDRKSVSEATLRAAITPNGGEMLGPDWNW